LGREFIEKVLLFPGELLGKIGGSNPRKVGFLGYQ